MKNILIPTDFSENAYSALYYATRLFKNEPCRFYILNTLDSEASVITGKTDPQLINESKEKLTEIRHTIVRDTEDYDHSFESILTTEKLLETIEKTVKEKGIDIIVMGTKGATGAKGFFVGSTTSNVIQKIKCCPVLVVPEEFNFEEFLETSDTRKFFV